MQVRSWSCEETLARFKARSSKSEILPFKAHSNEGGNGSRMMCSFDNVSENEKYVADLENIDMRLDDWHASFSNQGGHWWSDFYKKNSDGLRPEEPLRAIVAGMVDVAYRHCMEKGVHGGLGDMRSYGLRFHKRSPGEEDGPFIVEVLLLPREGERSSRLASSSGSTSVNGYVKDVEDLHDLLFKKLMPLTGRDAYSVDIAHLCWLMGNLKTEKAVIQAFYLCAYHSALWFWKWRYEYPADLWREYTSGIGNVNDRKVLRNDMKNAMKRVKSAKDWSLKLIQNSPLHNVYTSTRLQHRPLDVLHFGRTVRHHILDFSGAGRKYFDVNVEPNYVNEQYVELQFRKLFPLLIFEIYEALTPGILSL